MKEQRLYEFKCKNKECNEHFLAKDKDNISCPYCREPDAQYGLGDVFPVVEYTPGSRKVRIMVKAKLI